MKKVFIEVPEGADREPYIAHLESLGYKRYDHGYIAPNLKAVCSEGSRVGWVVSVQWLLDNGWERIEIPSTNKHKHYDVIVKWTSDPTQRVWAFVDKWVEIAITTLVNDAIGHHVEIRVQHDSPKKQIKIGEVWIDEPEKVTPERSTTFYMASLGSTELHNSYSWVGYDSDFRMLKRGLIHLTKEAAIAHAKALIALTGGECE